MIDIKDSETFILIKQAVWNQMYKEMSLMMSGAMLDTYHTDEHMVLMVMFPYFTKGMYVRIKVPLCTLNRKDADIENVAEALFDLLIREVKREIDETRHNQGD